MAVFGFTTPPPCGEKLTLGITILMSLTFYMNMVSEMQPPSSETPILGMYTETNFYLYKKKIDFINFKIFYFYVTLGNEKLFIKRVYW